MKEIPTTFRGWHVVRFARIASDVSERPNQAIIVANTGTDVMGPFTVLDLYSDEGDDATWYGQNGLNYLSFPTAERRFLERREQRDRFRKMALQPHLQWRAIAMMRWSHVPVSGRDEFTEYARAIAGKARDYAEFLAADNLRVAQSIEDWLTRYSEMHTHPDLRS